jgi:aminoglycoside 3-N-acetyltransferase
VENSDLTLTGADFLQSFRKLGIPSEAPVMAHVSLSAFGEVDGGAAAVVAALLAAFPSLIMPAFTFKTMLIPEAGPAGNGITYGSGRDLNRMALPFSADLPADRLMGILPETLRRHPQALRSIHPILSFTGVGVEEALRVQTLAEPLAPVGALAARSGWVLLLGVDHTTNTSIHYVERLVGRKQFMRWALSGDGAVECPNYPGCSDGFEAISPYLEMVTRRGLVGSGRIRAIPLKELVARVRAYLDADPLGLLCPRPDCERCNAVRATIKAGG